MVTYPLPLARYRRFFTDGVSLAIAGMQHSDPVDLLPPLVKHRSRMLWHIAEKMVNDPKSRFHAPGAVPVVVNQNGVADTAIGCVLFVTGDTVIRPVPGTVLDSISAKVIGELCSEVGLKCADEPIDSRYFYRPLQSGEALSVVGRTTELLLAGTGFCVAGVRRFTCAEHFRDYNWPGPVFRKLLAAWSDLVGVDIAKQFTEAGE
jgi:branched-chain amino acid aminotransferase